MKQFKIPAENLKRVLGKLSNAVSKTNVIPALSNILCEVRGDTVEFTSTDMEATIRYRIYASEANGGEFSFLIPQHLIQKIVSLNKGHELSFSMNQKIVTVSGDGDNYDLKTPEEVSSFPVRPKLKEPKFVPLKNEVIGHMASALKTVSKDELRPQLNRVLLEIRKNKTTVVSTDGSYMIFTSSVESESPIEGDLLIPEKVIRALENVDSVKVAWDDRYILFVSEAIRVAITKPEYKFVNYEAVIPKGLNSNLSLNRADAALALEKCSINTDYRKHTAIDLKTKPGKVVLSAKDTSFNIDIKVEVEGEYTGECDKVVLSASMLLRLLSQVDFYETIDLAIQSPNKPVLLRSKENSGYLGFIMPVNQDNLNH